MLLSLTPTATSCLLVPLLGCPQIPYTITHPALRLYRKRTIMPSYQSISMLRMMRSREPIARLPEGDTFDTLLHRIKSLPSSARNNHQSARTVVRHPSCQPRRALMYPPPHLLMSIVHMLSPQILWQLATQPCSTTSDHLTCCERLIDEHP